MSPKSFATHRVSLVAATQPLGAPTVWFELCCWTALLAIVSLAAIDAVSFGTSTLAALFFAVFAAIVAQKWASGTELIQDMRNFIYIGVLFWILLDPLQEREGIDLFSPGVIAEAMAYVAIFLVMVPIGYGTAPIKTITRAFRVLQDPNADALARRIVLSLYVIGAVPILYYSEGSFESFKGILFAGYNWSVDPGWRRGALGSSVDYFFTICFLIFNATPFLALWVLRRGANGPISVALLTLIVLSVPVFYFFSGSRRIFAFLVLGLMFFFYSSLTPKSRGKWRPLLILGPLILLLAMQLQADYRVSGFYDFDVQSVNLDVRSLHRDNIFFWLLNAVSTMPSVYPHTGELIYPELLWHPIPRFLWPEKPVLTGYPFVDFEQEGATLTISVIGQIYIAQGVWGVIFLGFLYGWAARHWDQMFRGADEGGLKQLIYFAGGVLFFVVGIRNYGEVVTQWYTIGCVVLVAYIIQRRSGRTKQKTLWYELRL